MGSDQAVKPGHPAIFISIHAPPHGERRENRLRLKPNGYISIHAPRMGSDKGDASFSLGFPHFNPRSPHGERRPREAFLFDIYIFQSTLPAWGATDIMNNILINRIFQSTLPAWGATPLSAFFDTTLLFQSTLPAWGATILPITMSRL